MKLNEQEKERVLNLITLLKTDTDISQYDRLADFREKLLCEVRKINCCIGRLESMQTELDQVKKILVASDQDLLGVTFDLVSSCVAKEIESVRPTEKEEKIKDLERRLITTRSKKSLLGFLEGIIGG